MKAVLKVFVISSLTIFLLCLNVNGRPAFESVYSVLSHVTVPFQDSASSLLASALTSTQDYSRKLFNNSVPKVKDAVRARASAPLRASGEPKEVILVEEKEELDELIKSHH